MLLLSPQCSLVRNTMPTVTVDGIAVQCPEGATLLEVCKEAGAYMSSLCYIDGLPPYAGCRTCLVEVEGQRGLMQSCTTKVTDGMVVRSETSEEVGQARKAVMSLILANHSDRCLTCPKHYRCHLQATCELVDMTQYESWACRKSVVYEQSVDLGARRITE